MDNFDSELYNRSKERTVIVDHDISIGSAHNIMINNLDKEITIILNDGLENEIKNFSLLTTNNTPAHIITTIGSFDLTLNEPYKRLIYLDDYKKWKILNSSKDSFYPSLQNEKIINNPEILGFGYSVHINKYINLLFVGGYLDEHCRGSISIYQFHGTDWSFHSKIFGYDYTGISFQGTSITSNRDGSIIAFGGPGDDDQRGAFWIFKRNNQIYEQVNKKLFSQDHLNILHQGVNLTMSDNGNILIVTGVGTVWTYLQINNLFVESGNKLCDNSRFPDDSFGTTISLNGQGDKLAVGTNPQYSCVKNSYVYLYEHLNNLTCNNSHDFTQDYWINTHKLNMHNTTFGNYVCFNNTGNILCVPDSSQCCIFIFINNQNQWVKKDVIISPLTPFKLCMISNDGHTLVASTENKIMIFINDQNQWILINQKELSNISNLMMDVYGRLLIVNQYKNANSTGSILLYS